MKRYEIALIGINGFGSVHMRAAEKLQSEGRVDIKAICETNQAMCLEKIAELKENGVNYYRDYMEMLEKEKNLDFVVVSTPIHLHREMAVNVMERGVNVLLEKPPAVTIQDIDAIISASEKTGKLCAVDFMLTADLGFLDLKKRISEGQLGKITSIRGKGLWKRLDSYYERTPWAGKLVYGNRYVLDGTVNNPFAHLLNNMLFLADSAEEFKIKAVTAELYHAHPIEAEDTSCIRVEGYSGLELLYYATLCQSIDETPVIRVEGTNGFAEWNYNSELVINSGGHAEKMCFGGEDYFDKITRIYDNLIRTISGMSDKLLCSIYNTRNFVLASNGAFESSGDIHAVPSEYISRYMEDGSTATDLQNISNIIDNAFTKGKLYSEAGVPWAVGGNRIIMDGYKKFGMFLQQQSNSVAVVS